VKFIKFYEKKLLLDDEGSELFLPKSEQISSDFYRKGDSIRAVISSVEIVNNRLYVSLQELLINS
jgi:N utilization substance protein A